MSRRTRIFRTARVLAVWLVIGAVVNVGLTWVLAGIGPHVLVDPRLHIIRFPRGWAAPVPDEWPPPNQGWEVRTWWRFQASTSTNGPERGVSLEDSTTLSRLATFSSEVGWPCYAMCYWWRSKATSASETLLEQHWGMMYVLPVRWFPQIIAIELPLRPLWPGFVLNAMFYATFCWSVLRGPGALRRWRRRRAGCCAGCGYDRIGLSMQTPCPECGNSPLASP